MPYIHKSFFPHSTYAKQEINPKTSSSQYIIGPALPLLVTGGFEHPKPTHRLPIPPHTPSPGDTVHTHLVE